MGKGVGREVGCEVRWGVEEEWYVCTSWKERKIEWG